MSILRSHNETFKKWQLSENPFRATPPEDPQKLLKVFHGREEIIKLAMLALYECRNVFIRGAWGMGKTAIIKTLLYKLQQEVKEINEKMLVLYLGGFNGDSPNDFYRLLILSLAKDLAAEAWDDKYTEIMNAIGGYQIQSSKTTTEGQVTLGIFNTKSAFKSRDCVGARCAPLVST
jgi:Cdc6-like AAA superfamily ATPase